MLTQLAAPAHFAAEFITLVAFIAAAFESGRVRAARGSRGLLQIAGFAGLAVAQGSHLALIFPADGALPLLVMQTVSFGLLAMSATPATQAGLLLVFVAGPRAELAVIPAVAAALVAARGAAAHRKDQDPATFAFMLAFVAFAAAQVATYIAAPAGGTWLIVAHALRAAGALLLVRWLRTSITSSIRLRFVAAFIAGLVILVMVISTALTLVLARNLEREELDRVTLAAAAELQGLIPLEQRAVTASQTIAGTIGSDVASRDVARLNTLARQALATLLQDVDFLLVTDVTGRRLAAASSSGTRIVGMPAGEAEAIGGSDLVASARETGRGGVTIDAAGPKVVVVFAAAPVRVKGSVVGVVALGYRLDRDYLVTVLRHSGAQAFIIAGGDVIATTDPAGQAFVDAKLASQIRKTVIEGRQILRVSTSVAGRAFFTSFVPLERANDGQPIAALGLARPASSAEKAQRDTNQVLFVVTLAAAAFAVLVAWLSGGRITKPIRALTDAAERVRGGDLESRAAVASGDEVGALGSAFNDMTTSIAQLTGDLRDAAQEEAYLRERMEAIMQSMGDGLIATDPAGRIVAFNRAAEQIVGRDAKRSIGKGLAEVLHGANGDGKALVEMALGGGGETELVRDGGVRVPVALTSAPLRDASGAAGGRVIVFRDISREAEAERMKSEFLSNVSHELRTPLTPIKGYTEILKRKQLPRQKAVSFLETILASTSRLERIVEILVEFSAIEAGRVTAHTEAIDVRDVASGVIDSWKERDRKHAFVLKVPKGVPKVEADSRMLTRCLDELFDNAVKFSPAKRGVKPKITIDAEVTGRGASRRVVLSVVDQGIGIKPDQLPHIFQDFRQIDGSETREFGGLGLGLAYAKRVMSVHGGEITATSRSGRGSRFSLVLPLADSRSKKVKK